MNNAPQKAYQQFNTASFEASILNAEVPKGRDFLAVTLITAVKENKQVNITFNDSAAIMGLFEKGALVAGRRVIVTGHIDSVSETYVDKDGKVRMNKRPNIHLVGASIQLGYLKKQEENTRPAQGSEVEVDATPAF